MLYLSLSTCKFAVNQLRIHRKEANFRTEIQPRSELLQKERNSWYRWTQPRYTQRSVDCHTTNERVVSQTWTICRVRSDFFIDQGKTNIWERIFCWSVCWHLWKQEDFGLWALSDQQSILSFISLYLRIVAGCHGQRSIIFCNRWITVPLFRSSQPTKRWSLEWSTFIRYFPHFKEIQKKRRT